MSTDRQYLLAVLKNYHPDLVVIESCGLAGWVHDICTAEGYEVLVCNPNQEAWKWKHIKRKTDRDDALKLAKLAALDQLVPVYIPCRQQREYRRLVKYRQVVLGRVNRVQNNIRSIFAQRGMEMMRGQKAWALERYEEIAQHRKPLAECSLDELWRGELDLELSQLEHLRQHQHEIHKQLQALRALISGCNSCRRSLVSDARQRKSSWPTWTILIASRTRGKYRLMQGWFHDVINPARWIATAASTNGARVNCAVRWSKRPGSCCATTPGPGWCTSGLQADRKPAKRKRSWPWLVSYWCAAGSCSCVKNLGTRKS